MKKLGFVFLVVNLMIINGAFVYLMLDAKDLGSRVKILENKLTTPQEAATNQGNDYKEYINSKLAELSSRATQAITPTKAQSLPKTESPKQKISNVSYVPIPGSGSTVNTDWTTLTGTDFYLSKSDYPGLKGIYFEGNIKLINGNGSSFVRLYDVTHSIGISGSEISTSSQVSTFVTSGAISFWEGYNHYAVQVKSLTADTSVFESGRLKIITEN